MSDYVLAAVAAVAAGIVNAIAGGGTLISFPTLVALGVPNVSANVTNTVALCPGYFGGVVAQRQALAAERARARLLLAAACLGGLTGSVLLVTTDDELFERLVPWLILFASGLLGSQQRLRALIRRRAATAERSQGSRPATAVASIFLVSVYGGYFGAGLGIMLLAVLGLLYDDELGRLNATKQLLSLAVNLVAATFFVGSGLLFWRFAAVMAPASLVGGALGGHLVEVINPKVLRSLVVVYGTVLAVYYLIR